MKPKTNTTPTFTQAVHRNGYTKILSIKLFTHERLFPTRTIANVLQDICGISQADTFSCGIDDTTV